MKIPAAEFKSVLKELSPVRAENFHIGPHGISAQDSDVWVSVESPLSELGSFTVAGKKLTQVINRMSGIIEIVAGEYGITLRSAKAEIKLEAKPAKKISETPVPEKFLTLKTADFKRAVALAVSTADTKKSAPFGGVVQFQTVASGVETETYPSYRIVGTDGKVLTVASVVEKSDFGLTALLNLTACGVVQIMESETLHFGEAPVGLYLKSGPVTLYASRSTQQYPGISPLLATVPEMTFKFKSEDWLTAYRTVEPCIEPTPEGENHVHLLFRDGVVQFNSSGTGATAKDESVYEQLEPDGMFDPVNPTFVMIAGHLSGFLSKTSGEATLSFSRMDKPMKLESGGIQVLTFPRKGSKK
jgi:hypothetical protein